MCEGLKLHRNIGVLLRRSLYSNNMYDINEQFYSEGEIITSLEHA